MAIAFVQAKRTRSTAANIAATFTIAPTSGNLLVAVYAANTATPGSLSGWTAGTAVNSGGSATSQKHFNFFYKISAGTETTVTITNAATTASLSIHEYSGVDTTTPLVSWSIGGTGAATTYVTPSITPTAGLSVLVFAAVMKNGEISTGFTGHSIGGATGVTARSNPDGTTAGLSTSFDKLVASTTGAYQGSAVSTSAVGAGGIAFFRAADVTGPEVKTTTGTLPVGAGFTGAAVEVGVSTGSLPFDAGLTGAVGVEVKTTTGTLPAAAGFTGSAVEVGVSGAALGVAAGLTGTATVVAVTTGTLPVVAGLTGSAVEVGVSAGTLPVSVALTGSATTVAAASGALPLTAGLTGTVAGVGVTTGTLPVTAGLTGTAATVGAAPSYAGTRTGTFDSTTSVYNNKSTIAAATALAATQLVRVLFVGDSLTAGQGATIGTEDPATQLRQKLAAAGHTVGELVFGWNSTTADTRLPRGSWTGGSITVPVLSSNGVDGISVTYTSTVAGTVAEIQTMGNSGSFTYSIDGGAAVPVAAGPGFGTEVITVTGLANTTHTVTITSTSTTSVFLEAVGVRSTTGFVLINAGQSNALTADYVGSDFWQASGIFLGTDPDVVMIEVGVNDSWNGPVPVETMKSNLTSIAGYYTVPKMLVNTHVMPDAYASGVYDVVDALDLPLLDLRAEFGNGGENTVDGTHFDATGYGLKADAWRDALAIGAAPTPTTTGVLPVTVGFAGAGSSVATATGSLPVTANLAGTAVEVGVSAGNLPALVALTGTATTLATTTGTLPITAGLTGAATEVGVSGGTLPLTVALTGSASTVAVTTGTLPLTAEPTGVANTTATAAGTLPVTATLTGSASTVATATGPLPVTVGLTGTAATTATTTGTLPALVTLTGSAAPVTTTTGSLPANAGLTGTGGVVGSFTTTGALPTLVGLTGTATVVTVTTTGNLPILMGFAATGTVTGALPTLLALTGTATTISSTTGTLPITAGVTGTATTDALPPRVLTTSGILAFTIGFLAVVTPPVITGRDITVTGTLLPRRWGATVTAVTRAATLGDRRRDGTIVERDKAGTITRRWEGTIT